MRVVEGKIMRKGNADCHPSIKKRQGYKFICHRHRVIKMTVNKEMTIAEIIRLDAGIIPILLGSGMHCIGCPSAQGESLEEACMVHGIEVDALVDAINEHLSANA